MWVSGKRVLGREHSPVQRLWGSTGSGVLEERGGGCVAGAEGGREDPDHFPRLRGWGPWRMGPGCSAAPSGGFFREGNPWGSRRGMERGVGVGRGVGTRVDCSPGEPCRAN